ncbi:hypothetical protein EDEG_03463 [Edhazardia aedis USNM 41457]|uniref:Lipoprotein n=1 Tax=Edhazardia aedis (strain USNM 41457) TaxID=1003232 RepID=J8ZR00_EDHAE|nr:hypothetical protein EDEG_03463 [Edhazardia aedis USNM 41457]|eukprot:EJW02103.1 hypothetical protein EDEG_03463 [Edhazardia aedis USNM 41457]
MKHISKIIFMVLLLTNCLILCQDSPLYKHQAFFNARVPIKNITHNTFELYANPLPIHYKRKSYIDEVIIAKIALNRTMKGFTNFAEFSKALEDTNKQISEQSSLISDEDKNLYEKEKKLWININVNIVLLLLHKSANTINNLKKLPKSLKNYFVRELREKAHKII